MVTYINEAPTNAQKKQIIAHGKVGCDTPKYSWYPWLKGVDERMIQIFKSWAAPQPM